MVTDQDEIKLIDFGIARTFQSQHQSTIIMTIGYAPPEQLHGMPEPRSDLYALGASIHRVLTHHDAANNKPSIFSFPPVRSLRPDISPAFEQVILKALAPAIEQRWSSAAEMERAIMNPPTAFCAGTISTNCSSSQPKEAIEPRLHSVVVNIQAVD
jgi:serine/threonine protein kinase